MVQDEVITNTSPTEKPSVVAVPSDNNTDTPLSSGHQDDDPTVATVHAYLQNKGLRYTSQTVGPNSTHFVINVNGDNGRYQIIVDVKPQDKRVLVVVVIPFNVPAARRMAVAEYLTRVNYNLAVGAFEMDFRDGEVRNRQTLVLEDGVLTLQMTEHLIMIPAATADRHFNTIMEVVHGVRTPEEAFLARMGGGGEKAGSESDPMQ